VELLHLYDKRVSITELERMNDDYLEEFINSELDYLQKHKYENMKDEMNNL